MKDIYELLNDVTFDENEFEEMEVTEFERAKVKKTLKKSIIEKKKLKKWKKNAVAVSIIFCISATTFGLTFPAYAKNIPVIDDIFRFFDQENAKFYESSKENTSGSKDNQEKETGLFFDYKKFSNNLNLTSESNGIKFTVNDAVFDGKTVTLTYTIESEREIGNANFNMPDIEGMGAVGGSGKTTKVDENKYVGILTLSNLEDNKLDVAKIKWNIDRIQNPDNDTEIKGEWEFAFNLDAIDNESKLSNSSSEKNGVKVNIEKITVTPMSFIVYYKQEVSQNVQSIWDGVDVELEIKDDLGNIYSGEGNGGKGTDSYNLSLSKTFEKLDQNATKLIITPHVTFRDHNSDTYTSVVETKNGFREIPLPDKPGKGKEEFKLKDIVIEVKK